METGNAVQAPEQINAQDPSDNPENDPKQEKKPDLAMELEVLKERYSHSSAEGKRLAEELKAVKQQLEAQRSLIKQNNNQDAGYDPTKAEADYIRDAVENHDKSEKEARLEWRMFSRLYENQEALATTQKALINRQRFEAELQEKAYIDHSPEAQKAIEHFQGIPELEALPTVEKVARYKELQKRMGVKVEGRDLSQVKMAASGAGSGVGGGKTFEAVDPKLDAQAKAAGFPSWKAAREFADCKTADQYAAFKQKYKIK